MKYIILLLALLWPGQGYACLGDCQLDDNGYVMVKQFEGLRLFPYKDVVGIETIGFGHVVLETDRFQTPLTGPEALALLQADVAARTPYLNSMLVRDLADDQWASLFDFAFNLGLNNLKHSTLLRAVNAGQDGKVPANFLKWDRAGGRAINGLLIRRRAEAALYERGIP